MVALGSRICKSGYLQSGLCFLSTLGHSSISNKVNKPELKGWSLTFCKDLMNHYPIIHITCSSCSSEGL